MSVTDNSFHKHTWGLFSATYVFAVGLFWSSICISKINTLTALERIQTQLPGTTTVVQSSKADKEEGTALEAYEKQEKYVNPAEFIKDGYVVSYKFYTFLILLIFVVGMFFIKAYEQLTYGVYNVINHYATPGALAIFDLILFVDWIVLWAYKVKAFKKPANYNGVNVVYSGIIFGIFFIIAGVWFYFKYFQSRNKTAHDLLYSIAGTLNIIAIGFFNVATLGSVHRVWYILYIVYIGAAIVVTHIYTILRLIYVYNNPEQITPGAGQ